MKDLHSTASFQQAAAQVGLNSLHLMYLRTQSKNVFRIQSKKTF